MTVKFYQISDNGSSSQVQAEARKTFPGFPTSANANGVEAVASHWFHNECDQDASKVSAGHPQLATKVEHVWTLVGFTLGSLL